VALNIIWKKFLPMHYVPC